MDLSKKNHWSENDILELIELGVKESINLDYKRSKSLIKIGKPSEIEKCKDEMSKDVSAFANSDGGILLYGVIEKENLPIGIDEGYDPGVITREWVEQVINSRIQRRIDGIRIFQVELQKTNIGRVLYVVTIPQSMSAPHMANYKYYKRFNFESVPMEDYEVRDVRRRQESPNLSLSFSLSGELIGDNYYKSGILNPISLNIIIINESPIVAEYYSIRIFIDKRLRLERFNPFKQGDAFLGSANGKNYECDIFTMNFSQPSYIPIWEGENFNVSNMDIIFPKASDEVYLIGWKISGPGAKKLKYLFIKNVSGQIFISEN